jgi:hypothetical protein
MAQGQFLEKKREPGMKEPSGRLPHRDGGGGCTGVCIDDGQMHDEWPSIGPWEDSRNDALPEPISDRNSEGTQTGAAGAAGVRGTDFVQNAMGIHGEGLMHMKRWLARLHHASLGEQLEKDFRDNASRSRSG